MKHYYNPEEYFLVGDHETRNIYVIHTFYKLLFKSNRSTDEFPCYLYMGKGVIKKDSRQYISRQKLEYAKELVSKKEMIAWSNLQEKHYLPPYQAEPAS